MQNELKYTVRSREVVDLVSAMRNSGLTLSPYFQRNLVWRDAHRRDFIETILKGFPFPQIFLARGRIDIETMTASQAVVDGQQRLSAILDFVNGKLDVNGRFFKELSSEEKESFLKYEVAVIDCDLDAGDPRLKDVFHRLNRTYYSLSAIEKIASEYSSSEFLLAARVLAGEINKDPVEEDEFIGFSDEEDVSGTLQNNSFIRDPGIDPITWEWMKGNAEGPFSNLIKDMPIFTNFEFTRKVPLMFTLNVMCSYLSGYYERNNKVRKYLDEMADFFYDRDEVVTSINNTATFIREMNLPESAMWWNKANFFTVVVELSRVPKLQQQGPAAAAQKLVRFSESVPESYALAAREAVGRKPQRELRARFVRDALGS